MHLLTLGLKFTYNFPVSGRRAELVSMSACQSETYFQTIHAPCQLVRTTVPTYILKRVEVARNLGNSLRKGFSRWRDTFLRNSTLTVAMTDVSSNMRKHTKHMAPMMMTSGMPVTHLSSGCWLRSWADSVLKSSAGGVDSSCCLFSSSFWREGFRMEEVATMAVARDAVIPRKWRKRTRSSSSHWRRTLMRVHQWGDAFKYQDTSHIRKRQESTSGSDFKLRYQTCWEFSTLQLVSTLATSLYNICGPNLIRTSVLG